MTAPEQPTPDIAKQIRWARDRVGLIDRGHPLRLGSDNDLMMMRAVLATLEDRDRFAAKRAAEAVETTDIGELLDSPPPPNEALTRLLTSPSPWGEQDREIAEIQEEHGAQWRLKHRWIIVDNGDGSFTVHEHSGDSVWPSTDYPNKRLAAARLLQLLGIGPVAPQAHPESVCIELPGEGTAADTTATPPPGDAGRDFVEDFVDRAEEAIALMKADNAPPPGDAGERARALLGNLGCWQRLYSTAKPLDDPDVALIAAALQSERTAAASQALLGAALIVEDEQDRGGSLAGAAHRLRALATPQEPQL